MPLNATLEDRREAVEKANPTDTDPRSLERELMNTVFSTRRRKGVVGQLMTMLTGEEIPDEMVEQIEAELRAAGVTELGDVKQALLQLMNPQEGLV